MKSFLEEYGFAILAAIVIILLIAMASPLGDIIRTQLSNIVNKFANSANKKLDAADAGDASAILAGNTLTIVATSKTDEFKAILHGIHSGKTSDVALKKTTSGDPAVNTYALTSDGNNNSLKLDDTYSGDKTVSGALSYTVAVSNANFDNGSEYYVEVLNVGTGEIFYSNRLVVKK